MRTVSIVTTTRDSTPVDQRRSGPLPINRPERQPVDQTAGNICPRSEPPAQPSMSFVTALRHPPASTAAAAASAAMAGCADSDAA